jgi:hypothetical protein
MGHATKQEFFYPGIDTHTHSRPRLDRIEPEGGGGLCVPDP